jgi:hypothetical protein
MRDMDETKVREELFELVRDVDVRPDMERATIRRARRRRALTASATALVAVALVAASYTGMRAVLGERTGQFADNEPPPTVPSPTPSASVSEPSPVQPPPVNVTGVVPQPTAETARQIYDGVLDLDFELLESLLDPMTFVYNFDDGSNPIPEWRDDPTVLDAIPSVLHLPPAAPREIEGYGTFYIWPYLVDTDFSALTEQEREDLASLGFSEQEIEDMIELGSYLGPRLAIDENGLWRNYVTGGD